MTDYDIEKVNPRPWTVREQWYSHGNQHDVLLYNIYDANNYLVAARLSKEEAFHIINCVNEHDRIRTEVEKLRDNEKKYLDIFNMPESPLYDKSIGKKWAFDEVLKLLDGEL